MKKSYLSSTNYEGQSLLFKLLMGGVAQCLLSLLASKLGAVKQQYISVAFHLHGGCHFYFVGLK